MMQPRCGMPRARSPSSTVSSRVTSSMPRRRRMLEPRWRKVLRDAWLHKARTLLVVLAIAVGLASAGALLDAWALVRRATEELYLGSEPAAATIRIDSLDDDLLAVVARVPGIRAARGRREALVALRVDGSWHNALLFAFTDYG